MKVAIMQPYFFPYLGYWQLIKSVELFVFLEDVNYIKKGYINRNSILLNGESKLITLEVAKASQNKRICDIQIGDNRHKLLKTIEFTYKKAPYFDSVFRLLKEAFEFECKTVSEFNKHAIVLLSTYLSINTQFSTSMELDVPTTTKGQDRILELCKSVNCDVYINSIGGTCLYDKTTFKNNGLELKFVKTGTVDYPQFSKNFVPNLSIIDILMFNDPDTVQVYLKTFELVEN